MTTSPVQPGLSTRQRHEAIRAELSLRERVEVSALADGFDVADETVRRDLRQLEKQKALVRVHGGAVLASAVIEAQSDDVSAAEDQGPLVSCALAAAPEAGTVFLGPGSLSCTIGRALPDTAGIDIVTNAIDVALLASSKHDSAVYNVGGTIEAAEQTGPWTSRILADVQVDLAFVETGALGDEGAVVVATPQQAAVRRLLLGAAERSVLLLTGDQGGTGFVVAARLEDFDVVICRDGLSPDLADQAQEHGVEVVVAA